MALSREILSLWNNGCGDVIKHQKPRERGLYDEIRKRHSLRAASRFSSKLMRLERDLCEEVIVKRRVG